MALTDRMIGAARLNVDTYEELERDTDATSQALTVVFIVAAAQGIGVFIATLRTLGAGSAILGLIGGIVAALLGWLLWSFLTYWVGTNLFKGTATWGELLRTLGFAYTPGLLGFFAFIPCVGALLALAGFIWMVVAGVVAVRQALDFDTGQAVLTVIIALIPFIIIRLLIAAITGV